MSTEQREKLEAVLRQSAFPAGSDVNEQRRLLRELTLAQPLPAAALVMSPYADLTLAGTTMETKREVDVLMSRENLQSRVTDYTSGQDAALGLISPIFADLSGLPPLIIQAGTQEVLLDDAVRLARQAATADVEVTLDITPGCRTSSKPSIRSSTKRPLHWTEPDSCCRRISPVQNASPHSERQIARDDGLKNESRPAPRIHRSRPSNKPIAPDPLSALGPDLN